MWLTHFDEKNKYLVTLALVSSRQNSRSRAQTSIFIIENQHFLVQMAPQEMPADSLESSANCSQPGVLSRCCYPPLVGLLPIVYVDLHQTEVTKESAKMLAETCPGLKDLSQQGLLVTYLIPGCVGRGARLGSESSSVAGAGSVWKSGNLEIWEFGDLGTWKSRNVGSKKSKTKSSQNPNLFCPKCRQGLD